MLSMEKDISNTNDTVKKLKLEINSLKKQLAEKENDHDQSQLESEYKNLYYNIPVGIMHYDINGIILDCNKSFIDMLGSTRELVIGLDMINKITDKQLVNAVKQSLITGQGNYEGTYKSITANKETSGKILFKGLRDENNKIYGGVCIAEDLSESIENQKALDKSKENYKLIFENTTDVYYRTTLDGTILSMSPAAKDILLIDDVTEVIGKSVLDFYKNPKDRESFLVELTKNEKVNGYRIELIRSNGSTLPVEFNAKLISNSEGNIDSIVGVFYDISAIVEAEIERQTNNWFFERLDKIDKVIRTAIDMDQVFDDVSTVAIEAFQCDSALVFSYNNNGNDNWKLRSSILAKNYTCDNNPGILFADPTKTDEIFDRILMYETLVLIDTINVDELNTISKEMGVKAQMMTSINLQSGNSLILCLNHCKDERVWNNHETALFTEMKNRLADAINTFESTELLHKSEEHHRNLIEATSEGYLEIDQNGLTTVANNAMCKMLGFSMKEFIGKSSLIFTTPESKPALESIIQNISDKSLKSFEIELQHKNGKKVYTLFNVTGRKDEDGNNIGAFFFVTDISKQKEAINKAEESDKLKTVFIKNISHEIRTPLNGIIGFIEMLKDERLSKEERLEYTNYVLSSSNQLTTVITDILEYSRLEAGQINTSFKDFNINYLLDEIYDHQFAQLESKDKSHLNFILDKQLPDEQCNINTDITKVKQIYLCLLSNAFKFTNNGYVKIGYKLINSDNIRLYVSDTGLGIPDNDKEIIFEKFRNGSTTNNAIYGGNGLGLAIAKSLTELMNGYIWFESEIGIGSQFYVNLPISKQQHGVKKKYISPRIKSDYKWQDKKILIVDDVYEVYKLISVYLKETEAEQLYAKNGLQAIELCSQNSDIDVVLLDIQLPDLDGYKVFSEIKGILKDVPIIAQTAFALSDDKEKTMATGFDDYITKPIYRNTLLEILDKYL